MGQTISTAARAALTTADIAFFDALGWRDSNIPEITSAAQAADYARREAALHGAVANLSFSERGESLEGRLAAALGARLADYKDKRSGEDD
jgi:hypothetical protein